MLIGNYTYVDNNYSNRIMEFANKDTRMQKKNKNLSLNNNSIKEFKLSNNINNNNNKILLTGDRYIPYKNNIDNIQNFILNSSPFNNNSSSSFSSIDIKPEKNYVNFIIDNMLKNSSEGYIIRNSNIRQNKIFSFSKKIYNTTNKNNQRKKNLNNEDLNNNLNLTIKNNKKSFNNELINEIDIDINNNIFNNINNFLELNKKQNIRLDNNIFQFDRKYNYRRIQKTPIRVLDAPNLIDDFYLNLLDWGKENIIAVSLYDEIYLWDDNNYQTSLLMAYKNNNINNSISGNNIISSLSFMNNGIILGVGLPDGNIQLWDINKKMKLREIDGHEDRVSCLSWNKYILSSGSRDKFIKNFDVRIKNAEISKIKKHKQEICSLKYSIEGDLLASGGNDNVVYIWDIRNLNNNINNFLLEEHNDNYNYNKIKLYSVNNLHQAAVKAMAWCPWKRHILATGGGSKDRSIKIYSCDSNKILKSIDTGSQVCALLWNQKEKEIISSHGYNKNQIIIWNYEKNNKISELKGHMNRVLYLAISPDETLICSGSGDETLRFWKINDEPIKTYEGKRNIYKNIILH